MAFQYKVRRLNTSDLFCVVRIMAKIAGETRDTLKGLDIKRVDPQLLGITLMEAAMKHAEDEFKGLLASLVGMTTEEFEQEPFDAPLAILEQVEKQEDLRDFFTKAQQLLKKFTGK